MTCDRAWEIDALREGKLGAKDADAFERHLRVCTDCAAEKANADRLRALAAASDPAEPSAIDLRRVRQRLLRSRAIGEPSVGPSRARVAAAMAAALAAVAAVALVLVKHHAAPPSPVASVASSSALPIVPALAGTVEAGAGAMWQQTRTDRIERVKLDEGRLHIHVRHQEIGERFFVDVPDGTLEVRGTTFDVETHAGRTMLVSVDEGVVAWKRSRDGELLLHAGDSWSPATAPAPRPVASTPHAHPTASSDPDDGSAAYGAALAAFRRGSFLEASAAFEHFLATYPRASQAEDASFLDALSLSRAGQTEAAARVARRHLALYPSSFHRKDASILVAREARGRGDCDAVRAVLAPWLGSASSDPEALETSASCIPSR